MKKGFLLALSLFLFVSVADVHAQSFLKELKETVKKEVGNRVAKEVKKQVNKGIDKELMEIGYFFFCQTIGWFAYPSSDEMTWNLDHLTKMSMFSQFLADGIIGCFV